MLQCIVLASRQIVIQHSFILLRDSFGDRDLSKDPLWFLEHKIHGKSVAIDWGRDLIRTAEALITTFLHCDSSALLATCPDIVYANLAFAGSCVVGMRLYTQDRMGVNFRGPGEKLMERTATVLRRIALDENHAAMRSSKVIDMMLEKWDEKKLESSTAGVSASDFPAYLFTDDDFWARLLGVSTAPVPIAS